MSQAAPQRSERNQQRHPLDPTLHSDESLEFEQALRQKIVGQGDGLAPSWTYIRCFAPICARRAVLRKLVAIGANRLGEDTHRRGRRRDSAWRSVRGHQSGLR